MSGGLEGEGVSEWLSKFVKGNGLRDGAIVALHALVRARVEEERETIAAAMDARAKFWRTDMKGSHSLAEKIADILAREAEDCAAAIRSRGGGR